MDNYYLIPQRDRFLNNKMETILNLSMRGFTVEQVVSMIKILANYSDDAKKLLDTIKTYSEIGYTIPDGLSYADFKNTLYSMTDMSGTTVKFLYGEATGTESYTVSVEEAMQYLYKIYIEDKEGLQNIVERAKLLKLFSKDRYDYTLYECGKKPGQDREELEKMRSTLADRVKKGEHILPVPKIPDI